MGIKKININILILITALIPINQIVLNYLFKIHFFAPITKSTNYFIQSTLVANLLSLSVFSVLIFVIGKQNLPSIWLTKEKLKTAILSIFFIWLLSQIITIVSTFFNNGDIVLVTRFNVLTGSLLGQLFGNATFEELIYRGIFFLQLYILLKTKTSNKKAIIISIIASQFLFAIMHIPNRLLINQVDNLTTELVGLFVAGVILTIIFIRTKNLAFVIGVHTLLNQPFNIIDTSFPMEVCIYILIILTTILWNKITPANKVYEITAG